MGGRTLGAFRTVYPNHLVMGSVPYMTFSITAGLRNTGLEVSLHCPGHEDNFNRPWVKCPYPWAPNSLRYRLWKARGLIERTQRQFIDRFRPGDVAWLIPSTWGWVYEILKERGVPIFIEFVNSHRATALRLLDDARARVGLPPHDNHEAELEAEAFRIRHADFCMSPSPAVTRTLLENGVTADRIVETTYGYDPRRIGGPAPRPAELPPIDGPTFLFCGSGCIRKGLHLLLKAWADADLRGRLVILGKVDQEIRQLCRNELNREDVLTLGHRSDVHAIYQASDAFVLPSIEEGSPLVTFEAMGSGLPCIVSQMGGGRIAEAGRGVILIDPYEHEAFVAALRRVGLDRDERRRLSVEAREHASHFTWDHAGRQRRRAIETALGIAPSAAAAPTAAPAPPPPLDAEPAQA